MIELPAAHVESPRADRVTILIPEDRREEWLILAGKKTVRASRQLYVKLGGPRRPRTTGWKSHGHAINGYCQQICEHTGEDFADVKLYAKRKAMRRGLPAKEVDGKIVYSRNDGEPMPISEADMDTEQASWVIEELQIIADELGIELEKGENDGTE